MEKTTKPNKNNWKGIKNTLTLKQQLEVLKTFSS